jgi:hypothetical protein
MPGEMARSDTRPSVRVTRDAGSGQHLASVLQEGQKKNANIDPGLGFIWRISVYAIGGSVILILFDNAERRYQPGGVTGEARRKT